MRGGIVAAGVVLILLGIFGWMLVVINPLIGVVLCLLSPILFIVGLVLFIVGLVVSPPQPMQVIVSQPSAVPMVTACPVCRQAMTFYAQNQRWYCHNCRQYR